MVLIVEDDETLGKVFARGLREAGYTVCVAATPEDGLNQMNAMQPTAIVLDFRMPRMNGLGFLYRLRSRDAGQFLPVVVVTGDSPLDDDVQAEFDELGAVVRFKPISPKELIEALNLATSTPSK